MKQKPQREQFEKNAAPQPKLVVKPGQSPMYDRDLLKFKNQDKKV